MSGGEYDPCECLFNHQAAMRRLLSLLRNNQGHCTDNECFQDGLSSDQDGGMSFQMLIMGWMIMAAVLFLTRPQSLRSTPSEGDRKDGGPGGNGQGGLDEGHGDRDPPAVM